MSVCLTTKPFQLGGWEKLREYFTLGQFSYGEETTSPSTSSSQHVRFDATNNQKIILKQSDNLLIEFIIEHHHERKGLFSCFFDGNHQKIIGDSTFPLELENSIQIKSFNNKLGGRKRSNLRGKVIKKTHKSQKIWTKLIIQPGAFYDCVIPEQIEALWGPIPLNRLPPQVENVCKAVTHDIIKDGKKILSVYLIHSLPLEMSAVQVFVGDKMAVVAHLGTY